MTTITLNLPEPAMEQARQAAVALQRPVEEMLAEMLTAVLPTVHDAPVHLQTELMRMTWLDSAALWQIAHSSMAATDEVEMQQLAQLQAERPLKKAEQKRLEELRQEYGRVTLLKARAYALLSLRGGKPLLNQV